MNIYDISRKTGVSTATVSRVINGSSNVSEKTRAKVLEAIDKYGYTPNVFARGLGLNTMKTVGIMCADSSDPYLAQAVYFVEENLRRHNYDVILSCTGYDHDAKERQMKMLLSKRVDAVILAGSNYAEASDELNSYIVEAAKKVPVMIINGIISAPNVYCTVCDDYSAMYEVTDRILSSGKKAPIYIYNSDSYSAKQKLNGFTAAVKSHNIPFDKERLLYISTREKKSVHFSVSSVKNAIAELAGKGFDIDCAVAAEDILAVGALKYAKEAGMSVPQDFAVAGYNNFDISECCDPELTSVDNRLGVLCEHCVSSLMSIFAESDISIPKHTVFSCEIIERGTTNFKK